MQGPGKTKRMTSLDVTPAGERDALAAKAKAELITVRPPPDVKPGVTIGERYRVDLELGRGGFGVVVRATHLTLNQRVAIKVLTEGEGLSDQELAEDAARFRREAKAMASLRSEHVVRVLDFDVLESGYPYIVMEYLEGRTLHELIYKQGPLSIEDAVDYVLQVLAALAEAHGAGIVHRDLKPANVFVSSGIGGATVVKVLDFGVLKMLGSASQRITRTGAVVGTVAYMAPEQMMDAKRVDGRADLWSAGLLLYEALAKNHPFGGATGPKAVNAILKNPLVPISSLRLDVPPVLDAIVSRLLEKVPDKRFSTAIEVAWALAPFASLRSRPALEEIRRAPPPTGAAAPNAGSKPRESRPPQRPSSPPRTKGRVVGLGLVFAFVTASGILGAIVGFFFYVKPRWFKTSQPVAVTVPAPSTALSMAPGLPANTAVPLPTVSARPSVSTNPPPAASNAPAACDPPFIYDPVANVRRSKPECL